MLCSLPEALAILDAHWQCLTNSEQRFWIFETLYDLGDRAGGLLCDSLELNPAQASVQILTQLSSDPTLAVLLYPDLHAGEGFLWLHLKLALTSEQIEHLFHEECLRRWETTAKQFREDYDAGYLTPSDDEQELLASSRYAQRLSFLETLRSIVEGSIDDVIHMTKPPVRIIHAGEAAFLGRVLGHDGTEQDDAAARDAYRTMLQTIGET